MFQFSCVLVGRCFGMDHNRDRDREKDREESKRRHLLRAQKRIVHGRVSESLSLPLDDETPFDDNLPSPIESIESSPSLRLRRLFPSFSSRPRLLFGNRPAVRVFVHSNVVLLPFHSAGQHHAADDGRTDGRTDRLTG